MTKPSQPRVFGRGPLHRWLGLELLERSGEQAELRLPLREEFLQEQGVVQGGILAALADASAVYALMPGLAEEETMTSIEFKLSFLSPVLLEAGPLLAQAEVLRRGRTIAVCRSRVSQGGRAVAEGLFTYLFRWPEKG